MARTGHTKVYLVRHRTLQVCRVAKVVSRTCEGYERLIAEADMIKRIKHASIPIVYDVIADDDSVCIIEEYIAGKSLSEYIANNSLSVSDIARIGVKLCEVLEYLHDCVGIVHMDIKPANVIVRDLPVFKLNCKEYDISVIDFDSALYCEQTSDEAYGTVGFAAPEQYTAGLGRITDDKFRADKTSDVYSVGMLLLYMLAKGDIQSMAENADKLCSMHSKTIGKVIRKCIRHSRYQRINSVKELKKELLKTAEGRLCQCYGIESGYGDTGVFKNIYVVGTRHGVGTTHISLCLSAFLHRQLGKKSRIVCVRRGDRNDLFAEALSGQLEPKGAYLKHGIYIMPDYGGGICCDLDGYDVRVYDCGTSAAEVKADSESICICVDTRGYGVRNQTDISVISSCDIVFMNHISGRGFYKLMKETTEYGKYYRMPCLYEWYETNRLFEEAAVEALKMDKKQFEKNRIKKKHM